MGIKGLVKKLKGSGLEQELPMLRVPEKVTNVGILMVTANRGLCGAYNSFVIKRTRARVAALNEEGIVPKLFIVGKKGVGSLNTRLKEIEGGSVPEQPEAPEDKSFGAALGVFDNEDTVEEDIYNM